MSLTKTYHQLLPSDYFDPIFRRVKTALDNRENTLIIAPHGLGGKTFFNFLLNNLDVEVIAWSNNEPITSLIKKIRCSSRSKIVALRQLEQAGDVSQILKKLNDLRQPNPQKTTYLVITDHQVLINPDTYQAGTNTFFSNQYTLEAFDFEKTKLMIKINSGFYGWPYLPEKNNDIYQLTGGIPRLIKHVCKVMVEEGVDLKYPKYFFYSPSINFQLKYLSDLIPKLSISQLTRLGILNSKRQFKSELLSTYFGEYQQRISTKIFPDLTPQESQLFALFLSHEQFITIDNISDYLKISYDDFSLWAIYKLISRLRSKISSKYDLINLKSRGYMLKELC